MKNFISTNDRTMFLRWDEIKHTHKPEVLETFLTEVEVNDNY